MCNKRILTAVLGVVITAISIGAFKIRCLCCSVYIRIFLYCYYTILTFSIIENIINMSILDIRE